MRYKKLTSLTSLTSLLFILITYATLVMVACPDSNPESSSTNTPNTPSFTFNIPSFTITFNLNKGTDDILPIKVSKGNTATKPKTPTKDNHTFGGWYVDSECKIPFFFTTKITKNLTLYAGWNTLNHYTVRFNTNGGVIPQKDIEQTVVSGGIATVPPTPLKTDASFGGWYTDNVSKIPFLFTTKITKNLTLYAGWNALNHYTVRFDTNGGTAISEQPVAPGTKATRPESPKKDDFVFFDWYTDENLSKAFDFDTAITESITLYAGWGHIVRFSFNNGIVIAEKKVLDRRIVSKPRDLTKEDNTFFNWYMDVELTKAFDFDTAITQNIILYASRNFTVTFDTGSDAVVPKQSIPVGSKVARPEPPTKDGYIFTGWYADGKFNKAFNFDTDKIYRDTTLYAGWNTLNHYIVRFINNDGTTITSKQVLTLRKVTKPPDPTKDGYVFVDWYADENLSKAFDFNTAITKNIILYAGWGHIVRFSFNNGIAIAEKKVLDGRIVSKPEPPTKDGYIFTGWYADGKFNKAFNFDTDKIYRDTTLYAGWNTLNHYIVRFINNDGTTITSKQVLTLRKVTKPPDPTKDGYVFVDWYADENLSKVFDFNTAITKNIILYAGWGHIVRFSFNNGTAIAEKKVLDGRIVSKPRDPIKEGLTFVGWYKDKKFSKAFNFDTDMITQNTALYALWNLTVTFDTGSDAVVPKQSIPSGTKVTRPEPPTKDGYVFVDWYADGRLNKAFNFSTDKIYKDTILYAGWGYVIRFNTNDGTAIADQKVLTWRRATKPLEPTKDGYIFFDWYKNVELTKVFDFNTAIIKNTTLYASWKTVVTFNLNGGTGTFIIDKKVLSGRKVPVPKDPPTKDGYVFCGWYTDPTFSKPFDFNTAIIKPITLYAGWGHTVRFDTGDGTAIADQKVLAGRKVTKPRDPTREYYIFIDWYKGEKLTKTFKLTSETIDKDLILYAKWAPHWHMVSAGYYHTAGIKTDGTLWAWGQNSDGQLGNGKLKDGKGKNLPVQVNSNGTWKEVSAGSKHTAGIKEDGTFLTWGTNEYGQLGNGKIIVKYRGRYGRYGDPKAILYPSSIYGQWTVVSAGVRHTAGIKTDGTLWTWGYNEYGQLGNGKSGYIKNTGRSVLLIHQEIRPVQVNNGSTWKAVSAGGEHTVGIKADGTLWAWGYNEYGQLGNGKSGGTWNNFEREPSPVQVNNGSTWKAVSAGGEHTVGIKADGTLWAWGNNRNGQLGNGMRINKNIPVQVGSSKWKAVSAGSKHTVGIKADGTLWAWGKNRYGQLGNGKSGGTWNNSEKETSPVQVGSSKWKAVSAGGEHTVGIKTDGTLWAWGQNRCGQLGNGKYDNEEPVPVLIGGVL